MLTAAFHSLTLGGVGQPGADSAWVTPGIIAGLLIDVVGPVGAAVVAATLLLAGGALLVVWERRRSTESSARS